MKKAILFFTLTLSLTCLGQREIQKQIQRQFIEVENGGVVKLPEGSFHFYGSLWLEGKKNVTIEGAGIDKTILNFKDQISGAEGIKVANGSNITIRDLTIQDTKGDGVKVQLVDGVTFERVKASWSRGAHEKNGGYGLYPVQCTNVLIDGCISVGASDAGIYVGQSSNIIVRNCKAYLNVAGIEIENSMYADVYNNEVYNNTGGILIFDLPDLIVKKGGFTRVFKNNVHDNNQVNFAPKGNIVGKVPLGTGVMILATRNVEVFENEIVNNITASTAIISYYMTENPINDTTYYPYPNNIYIHHNKYERPDVRATGKGRMGKMFRFKLKFGRDVPHIIYDGIEDPKMQDRNICILDNTNVSFADIDAENGFKNINRDIKPYQCKAEPLSPVTLTLNK